MKPTRFRYIILFLCFLLGVMNYLDRSSVAFFAQPIMKTFHIDAAGFGVVASAFGIGYLFFTGIGGWMADRFGARTLFGLTNIIWGLSTAAVAVAGGFGGLFVARAALGAAEGPVFPGITKAFTDWMPNNERTTALAYAIPIAVGVGLIIGGPLAAAVFSLTGAWQSMFYLLGVLSLVMAGTWYLVYRNDPERASRVNDAELNVIRADRDAASKYKTRKKNIAIINILKNPTLWTVYFGFFALGYFFWFVLTWLPDLLQTQYHITLSSSALFSILPWVAYVIGSFLGGYLSDRSTRRSHSLSMKRHLIWMSLAGSAVVLVPVFVVHTFFIGLACLTLSLGVAGVCVPPLWVLNSDVLPQRPGLSAGFMDAAFALAGILAPLISGFLVQAGGGMNAPVLVCAILSVAGACAMAFVARPDEAARHFEMLPDTEASAVALSVE